MEVFLASHDDEGNPLSIATDGTHSFFMDNAVFEIVPEPTALTFATLAGAGAMFVRLLRLRRASWPPSLSAANLVSPLNATPRKMGRKEGSITRVEARRPKSRSGKAGKSDSTCPSRPTKFGWRGARIGIAFLDGGTDDVLGNFGIKPLT